MRTTITLADDVAATVENLRRAPGVGLSEAVNGLVRSGLDRRPLRAAISSENDDLGTGIDVSNITRRSRRSTGPATR